MAESTAQPRFEDIISFESRQRLFGDLVGYLHERGKLPRDSYDDVFNLISDVQALSGSTEDGHFARNLEERLRGTEGMRFDVTGLGISGLMTLFQLGEISRRYQLGWKLHGWDMNPGAGLGSTADSAARHRKARFGSEDETLGNLLTELFYEQFEPILRSPYDLAKLRELHGSGLEDEALRKLVPDFTSGQVRAAYNFLLENRGDTMAAILTDQRKLADLGIPTYLLEPSEVARLSPGIIEGGFDFAYFSPTDGQIQPTNIVNGLERYCQDILGVTFHYNQRVDKVYVNKDNRIRFDVVGLRGETDKEGIETNRLAITTGASSKEFGKQFVINGVETDLEIPISPVIRMLHHITVDAEEAPNHGPFTIFRDMMYWNGESQGSTNVEVGYARAMDPEVNGRYAMDRDLVKQWIGKNGEAYFNNFMVGHPEVRPRSLRKEPDGLYQAHRIFKELDFRSRGTGGNLYGQVGDATYLAGLMKRVTDAQPDGIVGINAGHEGHGILAAFVTALEMCSQLVKGPYGLSERAPSQLWMPHRTILDRRRSTRL